MLAFEPHISESQRKCLLLLLTAYVYIFKNEKCVFDLVWGLSGICRNVLMIFSFILLLYSVDRVLCLGACCLLAWALPGCDRYFLVAHTLCSWDKHSFGVPYLVEGGGLCWLWIHTAETLRWFCWVNSASSSSALFFLHSSFEYHAWPLLLLDSVKGTECKADYLGLSPSSFLFLFVFLWVFWGDLPHNSQINIYRGLFFLVNA